LNLVKKPTKTPATGMTIADLNNVVKRMHFNQLLGIRVTRLHKDGVTIECPLRQELMNAMGVLHGGVTATMADAAVGIALWRHNSGSRPHTTVELKINYLAPVLKDRIVARARLVRVGQHLCIGHVDLYDGGKKRVGIAIVTYMLL
jgi:acyl-CoA thioesterase